MAGTGPLPKPPELRQRRNKPSTAATLNGSGAPGRCPVLPRRLDAEGKPAGSWHPRTKAWWRGIWASPMASQWLPSDAEGLLAVAEMVDLYWRQPDPKVLAEIRQQSARFGLSPLDRMRLSWKVEQPPEKKAAPAPVSRGPVVDPRGVLRGVS